MKIVSVMTTNARGGAEFAAVALLDALAARGHETVMLSDQRGIGRDTAVAGAADRARAEAVAGRAGARSAHGAAAARAAAARAARRGALRRAARALQEGAAAGRRCCRARCAPRLAWAEWGPVPFPLRRGLPRRSTGAPRGASHAVLAVSAGTRESVIEVGVPRSEVTVVPNVVAHRRDRLRRRGRRDGCAASWGSPTTHSSSAASRASSRRSATTSSIDARLSPPTRPRRAPGARRRRRDGGRPARARRAARRPRPLPPDARRATSPACCRPATSRSSAPRRPRGRRAR